MTTYLIMYWVLLTGSKLSVEEIGFYTRISVHNRSALRGILGPGSQGRVEASVQGCVGRPAPLAQPICPQVKDC